VSASRTSGSRTTCLPSSSLTVAHCPQVGTLTTATGSQYAAAVTDTLREIIALVLRGEVQISAHGYVTAAILVEDYPEYFKGPCTLVLQRDRDGRPIHVVWGIPRGQASPAVLVTAYRPDPTLWTDEFLRRRP
jgi:hypothetical protein